MTVSYAFRQVLGHASFGEVYLADREPGPSPVLVLVCHSDLAPGQASAAEHRLRAVARKLAETAPNHVTTTRIQGRVAVVIAPVHDVGAWLDRLGVREVEEGVEDPADAPTVYSPLPKDDADAPTVQNTTNTPLQAPRAPIIPDLPEEEEPGIPHLRRAPSPVPPPPPPAPRPGMPVLIGGALVVISALVAVWYAFAAG